jgi:hypothetical protein
MKRYWAIKSGLTIFTVMFFCQLAYAIGVWVPGKVTEPPWNAQNYSYMVVGDVKYTIMKDTVSQIVFEKEGSIYKDYYKIEDIRRGDNVQVLVEGNRIYQIQILR